MTLDELIDAVWARGNYQPGREYVTERIHAYVEQEGANRMKAYLDNPELKIATIKAMQDDIEAERLVQGSYWSALRGNGCFVGCVIKKEGQRHPDFETKLGIPSALARLTDRIFEGLSYEQSKVFAMDYIENPAYIPDFKTIVGTAYGAGLQPQWQDMARRPIDGQYVLATNGETVTVCQWVDGEFADYCTYEEIDFFAPLTHWMPLPTPPLRQEPPPKAEEQLASANESTVREEQSSESTGAV